jgi:hypothetical protein
VVNVVKHRLKKRILGFICFPPNIGMFNLRL